MEIRLRAALVVIEAGKILLVPHYQTEGGEVQWTVPGGKIEFGESIYTTAVREFYEETGFQTEIIGLFDVSEVISAERPYHSVTATFLGKVIGGQIRPESNHPFGIKIPQWFGAKELNEVTYHPAQVIEKAIKLLAGE
jgi:ADP-ribose pyrophosphatase YjhB (NUDIX family)